MIAPRRMFLVVAFAVIHAFATAIQAQAPEDNSNKRTGIISGSVTSASGELPNNATVYASPVGAAVPPQSAVVNSDGTFKIDNLEVGVYRVWAGVPGFVIDQTPDSRGIYHTGDSVNLTLKKGGVITGRVLNSNNAPVVAASVRAFRIRGENGRPLNVTSAFVERMTDDRGVYRIYSLLPGTYIVSAGGMPRFFSGYGTTAFDQDAPTFAPSSTRDTAQEVVVRSGDEIIADIQYRGEPGHAISGSVVGIPPAQGGMTYGASVNLTDVKSRTTLVGAQASPVNQHAFVFFGLPDGEYELVAQQSTPQTRDLRASLPKLIKIQGADITGVTLAVAPLPAIAGRVILDSSSPADCVKRRATAFQETLITAQRQKRPAKSGASGDADSGDAVPLASLEQITDGVPDATGDFIVRNLRPGIFRLTVQLPSAAWYLRSVTLGASARGTDSKIISDGIGVKQSVSGLTITISEGAAALRGQLTVGERQRLPAGTNVYMVPAEKENATNLLRYFETRAATDGTFALKSIPPGEYLMVARAAEADPPPGIVIRQDPNLRATIMREAEKAKQSVTLKPCQRTIDYELPFTLTTKP